jgi:hypothetical protein
MPAQRDLDLMMGFAFFLIGVLLAILCKAWIIATDAPTAVYVFGPGVPEPERAACEARAHKLAEETPE